MHFSYRFAKTSHGVQNVGRAHSLKQNDHCQASRHTSSRCHDRPMQNVNCISSGMCKIRTALSLAGPTVAGRLDMPVIGVMTALCKMPAASKHEWHKTIPVQVGRVQAAQQQRRAQPSHASQWARSLHHRSRPRCSERQHSGSNR